jgi:hypothetical protein
MVATMQYVSENTTIPVPQIHSWDSTAANELGTPYVLMDAVEGSTVYDLTNSNISTGLSDEQLYNFVKNWAEINAELATLQFDRIGSLYQKDGKYIINKLFTQMNITQTQDVKDDIYRGPFNSVADYLISSSTLKIHSEILSKIQQHGHTMLI